MDLFTARFLVPIVAPPIEGGALAVDSGRILGLGSAAELKKAYPEASAHDFGEAILLPPLVNAHTHLELTAFPRWKKEMGSDGRATSFVEWIKEVVRVKRQVSEKEYWDSLAEGLVQSLAAGTGAVGDILSQPAIRDVYRSTAILGRVFYEVIGVDPGRVSMSVEDLAELVREGPAGFLSPGASPHAPYSLSEKFLSDILRKTRALETPLSIHLAETPEEILFVEESTGPLAEELYPFAGLQDYLPPPRKMKPVSYLSALGGLGPNTMVVHGVHVTETEIDQLARSRASVVLCCRSNSRFGSARPPVKEYLAAGIPLALGTDSLASSDSLSVWDEIAFAKNWLGDQVTANQLLNMATRGGAKVLGLEGEMGELRSGIGAHFQILRPENSPKLREMNDFLCTAGRTQEVAELYLHGRRVCYN